MVIGVLVAGLIEHMYDVGVDEGLPDDTPQEASNQPVWATGAVDTVPGSLDDLIAAISQRRAERLAIAAHGLDASQRDKRAALRAAEVDIIDAAAADDRARRAAAELDVNRTAAADNCRARNAAW